MDLVGEFKIPLENDALNLTLAIFGLKNVFSLHLGLGLTSVQPGVTRLMRDEYNSLRL